MEKLTRSREAVLQLVRSRREHLRAKEILALASDTIPGISQATVYNSLDYLTENQLIRKLNFGEESARYDGFIGRHDHFICSACSAIFDGEAFPPSVLSSAASPAGFTVHSASLVAYGLCSACSASK